MVKLEQSVVNFVQIKHHFVLQSDTDVCRLLLNFTENSIETSQTNRSVSASKLLHFFVFSSSIIVISKVTNSTFLVKYNLGDFYTIWSYTKRSIHFNYELLTIVAFSFTFNKVNV